MKVNIRFPLAFDTRGRTAVCDDARHVREMIEEFLFTAPGERVNRPEFGSGILHLIFAPNSVGLAATLQASIQSGLQSCLGDLIEVKQLEVEARDEVLRIDLAYTLLRTGEERTEFFERSMGR